MSSHWCFYDQQNTLKVNYTIQFEMNNYIYNKVTNSIKEFIADTTIQSMTKETLRR